MLLVTAHRKVLYIFLLSSIQLLSYTLTPLCCGITLVAGAEMMQVSTHETRTEIYFPSLKAQYIEKRRPDSPFRRIIHVW